MGNDRKITEIRGSGMNSVVEAISEHARYTPDAVCVIDSCTVHYTYAEFWKEILCYAGKMQTLKLTKGDYLCIECAQNADFLKVIFACQLMGIIYIPLENSIRREKLDEIIQEIRPRILVMKSNTESGEASSFTYETLSCVSSSEVNIVMPEASAVSEILYTTGTTGRSKGIVLTNANDVAVAENIIYGTGLREDDVELIPLPLSHSHALRTCYANFLRGSAVMILDGVMNIKLLFKALDEFRITALDLSPSAAKVLLKLTKGRLAEYQDQIRFVELGTAFLDEEVKENLRAVLPQSALYNFYGSTESGRSCVLNFSKEVDRHGCIGKPAKNAKFAIMDEKKNPIASSEENMGFVAVAGNMNMVRYYNAPELTDQVFCKDYIVTNDLGYIDQEGFVYVFGRADDVINYKGIKISPDEIENVALKYSPCIKDCACVPMADKMSGQVPRLFIQLDENFPREKFDFKDYRNFLVSHLEENRIPKAIEIIDSIPRTPNGKLQRKKLREL